MLGNMRGTPLHCILLHTTTWSVSLSTPHSPSTFPPIQLTQAMGTHTVPAPLVPAIPHTLLLYPVPTPTPHSPTPPQAMGTHGAAALLAAAQRAGRGAGGRLRVLTHCNTGSLATAGWGTALGVIRTLHAQGALEHAYCTETRPYNQGAARGRGRGWRRGRRRGRGWGCGLWAASLHSTLLRQRYEACTVHCHMGGGTTQQPGGLLPRVSCVGLGRMWMCGRGGMRSEDGDGIAPCRARGTECASQEAAARRSHTTLQGPSAPSYMLPIPTPPSPDRSWLVTFGYPTLCCRRSADGV